MRQRAAVDFATVWFAANRPRADPVTEGQDSASPVTRKYMW